MLANREIKACAFESRNKRMYRKCEISSKHKMELYLGCLMFQQLFELKE